MQKLFPVFRSAAVSTLLVALMLLSFASMTHGAPSSPALINDLAADWDRWMDGIDAAAVDAYGDSTAKLSMPAEPAVVKHWKSETAKALLARTLQAASEYPPGKTPQFIGLCRATAQQALLLETADAVRSGDVSRAQLWRTRLLKPRGTSSTQGALILQNLPPGPQQRNDAAREIVREAITWQTTRARQLLDEAVRSTRLNVPLPGRLAERFTEASTLSDMPADLRQAAGINTIARTDASPTALNDLVAQPWQTLSAPADALRRAIESSLPSLLTEKEKERRQRLLLKLVILVPREYAAGVRDGQVVVPLEYREAVNFTAQARQMAGELAPLWLADAENQDRRDALNALDAKLSEADALIARKAHPDEVSAALADARATLEKKLEVSLRRSGGTKEIVEEVLLEVRSLLNQSLAAGLNGQWDEAEQFRLEAYTTFDPDLEARLMPRDPQLALDIERLLLDGIEQPGVKALLDQRTGGAELEAAYARVHESMDKAGAILKSGISATAATINAASIVLREGLEGLLVIVAILAGLRGDENARRRRLMWWGVALSGVASLGTWILSQTVLAQMSSYAELIEAVTAILAIGVLLLITNWLFHQIYWNQWVSSLKAQAADGESTWQLMSVGFLIGYREGFETIIFLQSLVMDAGGGPVGTGVTIGMAILIVLGLAAFRFGVRLPYFKMLMLTALLIGVVLVTFVGNGVRVMQTVGWLPVHKIFNMSWPSWVGQWLGIYNTWETIIGQVLIAGVVLGTWRVSRWKAKRAAAKRREMRSSAVCETLACTPTTTGECALHELGVGCCGEVVSIAGDEDFRRGLEKLGIRRGVPLTVLTSSTAGAVQCKLPDNEVSLHVDQARFVGVLTEA